LGGVDWHKAHATARESILVFRDIALAADVAKTNLTKFLKQHGLQNIRSL
jgi:phage antirepressor YoqD-like protein